MDFPGHFQHIFLQLNQQRLHAQLCDCVVVVGGRRFQAHRSILAACSSHFRALLSSVEEAAAASAAVGGGGGGGGAAGGPSVMELDPEVVTPEAFSTLLDMIYTSTLNLRASNVMDVLLAASHLHLNAVVKACKLHLSRKNFPASPPKGWRSVQQQQRGSQAVISVTEEDVCEEEEEEAGMEVSQSGGGEDQGGRSDASAAASLRLKRRAEQEQLGGRKRSCYKECSPTVSRSTVSTEESVERLLSPDCLKTADGHWEERGEEEVEEKYEATKGELEEMQLPSQSDSGTGGDTVVKVKVGEEEDSGEEPKVALVEVKKENLSSYSPDVGTLENTSPPSPPKEDTEALKLHDDEKTACQAESGASQLCSDLQAVARSSVLGDECVDGEGLESLSELAFSCFLSPSSESVMGALEDDSLAGLTAAATAAAAASDAASAAPAASTGEEPRQNSGASDSSSSSSSLVFPVTSVPLQQLPPGFSDTLILQPAQSSLTGFLSSVRPLETPLVHPSKAGKSSGTTTFRRIAPKVPPGSEVGTDHPSGEAADRPALTRASEDVLSKCKKAAAEDHVLLVEGEKKYACKICCKTFMNLTDCKKHIRVHTGEKPYPCPKCGKRFSQSSHLYKHSKNTCVNWKDEHSLPESLLAPALNNS